MDEQLELFITTRPDAEQLRKQYPELSDLLTGTFAEKPFVGDFESGTVVSWELIQGKKYNPSYGRLPAGHFEFPTGKKEEITILEGTVTVTISEQTRIYNKSERISVPSNTTLILDVASPLIYLCEYKQKP